MFRRVYLNDLSSHEPAKLMKQTRAVNGFKEAVLHDKAVVIQRSWQRYKQKKQRYQGKIKIDNKTQFSEVYLYQVDISYKLERFIADQGAQSQEKRSKPILSFVASCKGMMRFRNNLMKRRQKQEPFGQYKQNTILTQLSKRKINYQQILLDQDRELRQLENNYKEYSKLVVEAEQCQKKQLKQLFSVL